MAIINRQKLTRPRVKTWLVITFIISLLLLVNALGWVYYKYSIEKFDDEMGKRLSSIAASASNFIQIRKLSTLIPGDENAEIYIEAKMFLERLKDKVEMAEVTIFSTEKYVIVSTNPNYHIGSQDNRISIYEGDFLNAVRGKKTSSTYYTDDEGNYYKRGWAPINDIEGRTKAVMMVVASVKFFDDLRAFKLALIFIAFFTLPVVVVVTIIYNRILLYLMKLQERVRRSAELANLGELAAGVAHEIRNPLGIINGTAEVLEKKLGDTHKHLLEYIKNEVERLNKVVDNFLSLARYNPTVLTSTDLNELLTRTITLCRTDQYFKNVDIVYNNSGPLPKIKIDKDKMEQVVLNMLRNARDAMSHIKEGAKIEISTEIEKRRVKLLITDHGKGISKGDQEKIFDPFFSTKEKGTGLGLAIVHNIITQHEGSIELKSVPNQKTTFIITLPR